MRTTFSVIVLLALIALSRSAEAEPVSAEPNAFKTLAPEHASEVIRADHHYVSSSDSPENIDTTEDTDTSASYQAEGPSSDVSSDNSSVAEESSASGSASESSSAVYSGELASSEETTTTDSLSYSVYSGLVPSNTAETPDTTDTTEETLPLL
ncbi:hypothetical protein LPJ60_003080 [Coemansia sp. RSA 2675]|nr:hypothetical protein LPJ60_003080 [Coemansia sp. RSA 2675]